jgi:hypothetical protein
MICNSYSVSQQSSCNLWNLEVHYHVHKVQLVVTILSQVNAVCNLSSDILRSILMLFFHLYLGLPSGLFHLGFQTTTVYSFLPLYMPCAASSIAFTLI